jgi:hypothetical protein
MIYEAGCRYFVSSRSVIVAMDVDVREARLLADGIDVCGGWQQRRNAPR